MSYSNPPQPMYQAPGGSVPGRGLAIAGLIVDFFIAPLGLILSIVAKVQSRRAGARDVVSTIGIVLGILFTIGAVIVTAAIVIGVVALAHECSTLGPGVHYVNGVRYTCS